MRHPAPVLIRMGLPIAGAVPYGGGACPWFGRLPGDIRLERPGGLPVLPLSSCALISVVLTLIVICGRILR